MNNNISTFIKFISEHSIQIPLIQRDYVQGIAYDEKTKEKRDDFIRKLMNAILPQGKPYTLDFIYGARESFDTKVSNPDAPFLPLDGQQRLTTLLLLHWILIVKTNNDGKYDWVLPLLQRFSYKTRVSSDKFCRKLLTSEFEKSKPLCPQIRDKSWFTENLKADPTIMSMMEMIQAMEGMLDTSPYQNNLERMAENLLQPTEDRIRFSILDMEKYHLTDGLYVKMNARGKELTPFENWKADFINLISNVDEQAKNIFTKKIEHEWNDVFWTDVYQKYDTQIKQVGEEKQRQVKYPRIDEHFMNFFTNMSRLFYFIYTPGKENAEDFKPQRWSTIENLYGNHQEAREDLFAILDVLSEIKNKIGIDTFFGLLFYTDPSSEWKEHDGRVKLFGYKEEDLNLFKQAYKSNEFSSLHILLLAILKYCAKHQVSTVTLELKTYTRICRDYLFQHNYLDSGSVTIMPQIRVGEMKKYEEVFRYLRTEVSPLESLTHAFSGDETSYVKNEQDKINYYKSDNKDLQNLFLKIEDMSYTHGNIKAFSTILKEYAQKQSGHEKVWAAIYSFIKATSIQKVQLFLALNYKGLKIGNNCAYGERIFMGGQFRKIPRWDVHFRKNEIPFGQWLTTYVAAYIELGSIQAILDKEKSNACPPKTLRDYMLKYEDITAAALSGVGDFSPFYYAMPHPWQDMDLIVIHSFSSRPLGNSYQTCPMVYAVTKKMEHFDSKHIGYAGTGSNKAGIMIHNEDWSTIYFALKFGKKEWFLSDKSYENLSEGLKQRLECKEENDGKVKYILQDNPQNDLIENAAEFMNDVVKWFKGQKII